MSVSPLRADMLSNCISVRKVPIADIRAPAQFFWVACHHLSARLDGAEPVPPGGPVELVMLNAPDGELGKAGPLGCHRQGSHAVSLRASGELDQRAVRTAVGPTTVPSMNSWVRPKNCILSCRPLNAISTTARSQSDLTICSCCRGAVSGTQQRAQFMATRTTRRRCRWDESSDKPTTFPRTTHEGRCNTRRSNSELANASSFQRQVVGVSIPRSRANSVSRGPSAGGSLVLIR